MLLYGKENLHLSVEEVIEGKTVAATGREYSIEASKQKRKFPSALTSRE